MQQKIMVHTNTHSQRQYKEICSDTHTQTIDVKMEINWEVHKITKGVDDDAKDWKNGTRIWWIKHIVCM